MSSKYANQELSVNTIKTQLAAVRMFVSLEDDTITDEVIIRDKLIKLYVGANVKLDDGTVKTIVSADDLVNALMSESDRIIAMVLSDPAIAKLTAALVNSYKNIAAQEAEIKRIVGKKFPQHADAIRTGSSGLTYYTPRETSATAAQGETVSVWRDGFYRHPTGKGSEFVLQIATIDGKRTFTAFRMDGAAVDPKLSAITSANGFSNTASILAGGTKSVNARKWLRFYATDPRIDTTAQGETIDTDTDADTDTDTDTDTSTPAEG